MDNKWLSGMMGLVVGDALGVPVEFMTREKIKNRSNGLFNGPVTGMEYNGTYRLPVGTWSDDSSMAIATLVSIIDNGELVPEKVMDNFVLWEKNNEFTATGHVFDIGITCHLAIDNYVKQHDIYTCGMNDEYSNGNGSLMRILPACLYYYEKCHDDNKEAISGIDVISGLTHSHLRSKIACGLYYFMIKAILDNDIDSIVDVLQIGLDSGFEYYSEALDNANEILHYNKIKNLAEFKNVSEDNIKGSGYVVCSLEAALWCLINTDNYKDALLKAVNLGDDTDTVAAIAGGLGGLYYGYEGIPSDWVAVIKKREWLEDIFQKADNM